MEIAYGPLDQTLREAERFAVRYGTYLTVEYHDGKGWFCNLSRSEAQRAYSVDGRCNRIEITKLF